MRSENDMSAACNDEMPFASPLQCYICICNKAHELQNGQQQTQQRQLSVKDCFKEREKDIITPNVICRGCKLQRYCSVKHLVQDHPAHRFVCRVLIDLQKTLNIEHPLLLNGVIKKRAQLQQIIAQLMLAVRVKLRRLLTRRECELLGYPGYCVICYRLDSLTACTGCAGVAYCSSEHRRLDRFNHTPAVCQTLALYYSPYRHFDINFKVEHFKHRSVLEQSHLIEAFYNATGLKVDSQPWRCLEDYARFSTCSSFSGIGSICLALSNLSFVAEQHKILSVYVVGASESHRRYFEQMHLKFFFLQYEDIRQLDLYFIGSKLLPTVDEEEVITFELQSANRRVVKRTFSMTFARFTKTHKVDPVLIVIYNPDFSDMGNITGLVEQRYSHAALQTTIQDDYDWHSCLLETLYTYGVPICLTSPTKMQTRSDMACVNMLARTNGIAVKRIYNCTENPYREILPLHNPCPDHDETIIYANNYLDVIFTSIKC